MRLRRNDTVIVTRGRDRGRTGKVQQVFPKDGTVLVEGINRVTKHMKPRGPMRRGGLIQKGLPLDASNVMLVCPSCNAPSRVGYSMLPDESKARVCRNCKETIA